MFTFVQKNQIHWFTGGFKPKLSWFSEEDLAELSSGPAVQKCCKGHETNS